MVWKPLGAMTQEGRNQVMVGILTLGIGISGSGELSVYFLIFKDLVFVLCKLGKFIQTHGCKCYLSNNHLYLQFRSLFWGPHLTCLRAIVAYPSLDVPKALQTWQLWNEFITLCWLSVMDHWINNDTTS